MIIIHTNQLDEAKTAEIRALEEKCREHDGLKAAVFLSNEINFDPNISCFFTCYEEQTLVGFLSLFVPTQAEAEVSAFTLPEYRKTGVFHSLLAAAREELKRYEVKRLLFVCEPQSAAAKAVITHYGAKYEFSEYLMHFDRVTALPAPGAVALRAAARNDLSALISLSTRTFGDDEAEARSMLEKSMDSPEIDCYSALLNGRIIGMCNVNREGEELSIFGVGVEQDLQGKGYGRQMLSALLRELCEKETRKITLEVNSENAAAYHLYKAIGFSVETQFDYYGLAI